MRSMKNLWPLLALLLWLPATADESNAAEAFLEEAFHGKVPEPAMVWLSGERKQAVARILGHNYPALRIRYWRSDQRSAWILEETGKEQPITIGVIVNDGTLERIKVLAFRESRGGEIRYPFFTDQFKGIGIDDRQELNRHIDGISGATLSVTAMKKVAALALYLDSITGKQDVQTAP
ncbi:FMN-binding protein [Thiogranum longum]|uniref:FMN-binding protein n=1 Tax=Thiogranum longum TaxID=1537524 RepID=A0A4R1HFW3_9GAMM|nr:FMN-binding protein [Thiogranum longum]TCK19265.1 FMN-binding protein [Thiogranum longum]